MTADRQGPATDTKAEGVASEAALFVTFYSPREKATPLYERLESLIQQNPNTLSPRSYDPPAAQDATIIRFAINAPKEDAATAWETTRQELKAILDDKDLPKDWWGYTLIYQGVLRQGVDLAAVSDELLSTVRRLDSPENLEPLEQADIAGGRVWLMGIPRGDGLAAATVYVAFSPFDKEKAFKQALFGPELSMLDLIAHKGYRLRREYRGNLERDYEKGLNTFRESTYDLLNDLGHQIEETDRLDDLARKHEVLVKFVSELKRLRISVAQQLPNYRKWQDQTVSNGITEFHYGHLDMTHHELELMVAEGQDALETANTAMSMVQVKVNEAQERSQLGIEALLAAVGMALALPHLLESETTAALLWWIGIEVPHTENSLLTESGHLVVLLAQFLIILAFAVAAYYLVVKRALRKPRGFHKRAQS